MSDRLALEMPKTNNKQQENSVYTPGSIIIWQPYYIYLIFSQNNLYSCENYTLLIIIIWKISCGFFSSFVHFHVVTFQFKDKNIQTKMQKKWN